jgi:hypothetical protein
MSDYGDACIVGIVPWQPNTWYSELMRFYFSDLFESAVELVLSFDSVVFLFSLMAKKGGASHKSYPRYNHYYHLHV